MKTFDENSICHFTDLSLAQQEAENNPGESDLDIFTDTHIVLTLADVFLAGVQTSRQTLRFAIFYMVAYPEIQTKVQTVIDRVVTPDELPKLCHRPLLSYTEVVLNECM